MRIEPLGASIYTSHVWNGGPVSPIKPAIPVDENSRTAGLDSSIDRRKFDTFEVSGEKPDFKAVDLIKKSEIQPIEPNTNSEISIETSVDASAKATDTLDINFESASGKAPETSGISFQRREEIALEKAEESTVNKTSDEIAQQVAGNKLTPAQQKGVETYQRFQSYSVAMNLSYAASQIAG